ANAADLGGNCCADLEERVAELEATTARKGNRKVSLTISGWVGEQVMWWDDDFESNTYVGGLGTTLATNVKFTGQATIVPGWTAGYVIHIEADGSDMLLGVNQSTDNGAGLYTSTTNYVQTLQSFWFIKSDHWGKVGIGLQSQASDNTAILVDGSGSLVPANFVQFDYGGFNLRDAAGNIVAGSTISDVMACTDCNGLPVNAVRYDTPTFAGFSASASWGEDDFWDIALRYAGEVHSFKIAAAAAYAESSDGNGGLFPLLGDGGEHFQVGAYAQHIPTGIFLYAAYSNIENENNDVEGDNYYIKAGVRGKWNHLGATIPYFEYQDGQLEDGAADVGEVELWGLGVVQEIDAAAMSLWLSYRNIEADSQDSATEDGTLDFQYVKFGALINF
ncbi:MAG: porin, partial [Hyphomicrobium sp.]|uniref:porin n=1 Tax=Hyphomicrobium sp. TaxID=82 RepID=UPI003D0A08F3